MRPETEILYLSDLLHSNDREEEEKKISRISKADADAGIVCSKQRNGLAVLLSLDCCLAHLRDAVYGFLTSMFGYNVQPGFEGNMELFSLDPNLHCYLFICAKRP